MLRKPVQSNWSLLPGYPDTYESLQQNSQIVLQEHPLDANRFIATLPLIAFRSLVATAKEAVATIDDNSDRFKYLYKFMGYHPSAWQNFRAFAINHTALMNKFFANADLYILPLSRRYVTEYDDAKDINLTFFTKSPKPIRCTKQFPKTSSVVSRDGSKCDFADGNFYLNAPSAQFGDGFYVCCEAVDEKIIDPPEDADMDKDNDSGPSPTRSRPSKLCIVEQYKDWQGIMTFANCIDEYEKTRDSWENAENIENKEDFRLITALISTSKVAPPEEHEHIPQDLLVVDMTKFKVFFGILEPLLCHLPSRDTNRLAINTADQATLEKE